MRWWAVLERRYHGQGSLGNCVSAGHAHTARRTDRRSIGPDGVRAGESEGMVRLLQCFDAVIADVSAVSGNYTFRTNTFNAGTSSKSRDGYHILLKPRVKSPASVPFVVSGSASTGGRLFSLSLAPCTIGFLLRKHSKNYVTTHVFPLIPS